MTSHDAFLHNRTETQARCGSARRGHARAADRRVGLQFLDRSISSLEQTCVRYSLDLVDAGLRAATGVFHLTNAGACSWFEYAEEILALAHLEATVEPVRSSDHFSAARRPRNSSLRGLKVDGPAKQSLRPWEEALKAYLDDRNAEARPEP